MVLINRYCYSKLSLLTVWGFQSVREDYQVLSNPAYSNHQLTCRIYTKYFNFLLKFSIWKYSITCHTVNLVILTEGFESGCSTIVRAAEEQKVTLSATEPFFHLKYAFSSLSCRSSRSIFGKRASSVFMFLTITASCSCWENFCSRSWKTRDDKRTAMIYLELLKAAFPLYF